MLETLWQILETNYARLGDYARVLLILNILLLVGFWRDELHSRLHECNGESLCIVVAVLLAAAARLNRQ